MIPATEIIDSAERHRNILRGYAKLFADIQQVEEGTDAHDEWMLFILDGGEDFDTVAARVANFDAVDMIYAMVMSFPETPRKLVTPVKAKSTDDALAKTLVRFPNASTVKARLMGPPDCEKTDARYADFQLSLTRGTGGPEFGSHVRPCEVCGCDLVPPTLHCDCKNSNH